MKQLTGIGSENVAYFKHLMDTESAIDDQVAVGAVWDNATVGMALFSTEDSTLFLDYIYVDPAYRKKGVASDILKGMQKEVAPMGCHRMEVYYESSSDELDAFFNAMGFATVVDEKTYKIPASDFLASDFFQKIKDKKASNSVVSMDKLNDRQKKLLYNELVRTGFDVEALSEGRYDPTRSFVVYDKDGVEAKAVLYSDLERDVLTIILMVNMSNDPIALTELLISLRDTIDTLDISKLTISFLTVDEGMDKIVRKLAGDEASITEGNIVIGLKIF